MNIRAKPAVCLQPKSYNETCSAHLSQLKFIADESLDHIETAWLQLFIRLRHCGQRAKTFCEALRKRDSGYISLKWIWQKSMDPSVGGVSSTEGEQPIKVMYCKNRSPTKKRFWCLLNGLSSCSPRNATSRKWAINPSQDVNAKLPCTGCNTNLCICSNRGQTTFIESSLIDFVFVVCPLLLRDLQRSWQRLESY